MRKEQFLKAAQPVPEHLRGTRQGLFHMLSPKVAPMPETRLETMRRVDTMQPDSPAVGVHTVLQSDDFIFSD
jgi:hypothetical protein